MDRIKKEIFKFRDERDWKQFHTPSNLSKSIAIEAAELLENFQWNDEDYDLQNVKEEIADIMVYCIQFADYLDMDIEEEILLKLEKNKKKYPIEKAKGSSKKYTEYDPFDGPDDWDDVDCLDGNPFPKFG